MNRHAGYAAIWTLVAVFSSTRPLFAEEIVSLAASEIGAWEEYFERTQLLETELVSLRGRLDSLETNDYFAPKHEAACVCPRLRVSADYLNWALRRRDLDFAIPTDDSALAVGAGSIQRLGFERDSGVRFGIGYLTRSGWEIGFGYTYFHASAADTAQEPAVGNLWATRSHPNRNEEAETALGFGSFNYQVFDLEAGHDLCLKPHVGLKLFGGLRYANIDQHLLIQYDGRDFDNGVVNQPVNMDAIGFRLGLDGRWQIGCGWSVFGRAAGSVMYGEFHTRKVETNVSGADVIVNVDDNYEQAVPVLEAALGLSWQYRCLEIAAGYEFTSWFNLADRSTFVDSVHEGLYVPVSEDVLLDGFFIRTALSF